MSVSRDVAHTGRDDGGETGLSSSSWSTPRGVRDASEGSSEEFESVDELII